MRVTHLVHSLRGGGAERIALELACGMLDRGYQTSVVTLLDTRDYFGGRYMRVPVRHLMSATRYDWPWCISVLGRALRAAVEDWPTDVIEVHTPTAAIVAAFAGIRVPCVQVFHGYAEGWRPGTLKHRLLRALQRYALDRFESRAIALSEDMAAEISRNLNCARQAIRVVPNGVDLDSFPFRCDSAIVPPVICVIGTLSAHKRPADALQAFAKLRSVRRDARLRFLGDGALRGDLQRCAAGLGVAAAVDFSGWRADLAGLLHKTALVWHLSASEGLPLACLEAMSTGVPVIGTNVRGIRDVIVDGVTGWLVPLGDCGAVVERSLELLDDPGLYRSFAEAGRRRVETQFSATIMIERHIDALRGAYERRWQAAGAFAAAT